VDQQSLFYLIPYLLSAATSVSVAAYCWRHRSVVGAKEFGLVSVAQAFATLGLICELLSPTLNAKLFWDNLQWFSLVYPVAMLAFTISYTGLTRKYWKLIYGALAIYPISVAMLAFTDPLHGLMHPDARLITGIPFSELTYTFTPLVFILLAYIYVIELVCFGLLIRRLIRAQALYRAQVVAVIAGQSIPLMAGLLIISGIEIGFHRDITPFAYALGQLVVVWGLLKYRLLDISPIAREQLIEEMTDFVLVVDQENRIIDINPALAASIGKPASALIGMASEAVFTEQIRLVESLRDVNEIHTEIKTQDASGTKYYDLTISPIYNRKGEVVSRLIISRDITTLKKMQQKLISQRRQLRKRVHKRTAALTKANQNLKLEIAERKHIEIALRDSDEHLRRLNEAAFEGILITEQGRILQANAQIAAMLNTPLADLMGKQMLEFVAPQYRDLVSNHIQSGDNQPYRPFALRSDGTEFPVEVRSRTIRQDGRALRMTAIRDITERFAGEEALRQSEERFRLIVENMPILLDAFDDNGNIIVWNKACEEVTGYSAAEIIGNPRAMELLYPNSDYRAYLWEVSTNPESTETTFDLVCKNGETRTITWFETYRTLTIPGWTTWGMGQDITERRRSEEAVAQSRAELSRSNALITALAEVATQLVNTHDLSLICEKLGTELQKLGMHTVINLLDDDGKSLVTRYMTIDLPTQAKINQAMGSTISNYSVPLDASDTKISRDFLESRRTEIEADPIGYMLTSLFSGLTRVQAEHLLQQVGIHANSTLFWYPLIVKDQVVGAMTVWGQDLKKSDSLALSVFAGQVASVMLNAKLYQAERDQREMAEALRDSAAALNSTLSLEEVLNRILDNLGHVMPHDAANIMLVESGVARIVGKRGYAKRGLDTATESARWIVSVIPGLKRMSETGQPIAIPDTHEFPAWVDRPESRWIRSIAGAPIRINDEVIGFLNLDSATPGFFSAGDAARLQAFADQAAIGIHNARLYEAERHERILAQTLQKTAAALIRTVETEDTLALIMDQLAEVVPYDQALLMLVEENYLTPVAARGLTNQPPIGEDRYDYTAVPILWDILSSGQPLVLDNVQDHLQMGALPGAMPSTHAWMAVPLITWSVVTGLLIVGCNVMGRYDDTRLHAAAAFAQQAAIAMENVRMMTELSQTVFNLREAQARLARAARLSAAGEIAAGVAHQINNPLTAIIAEVSLLLNDLSPDAPGYESAQAIHEAAHMAGRVVQRQLNLSRSVPYEMQPSDINQSLIAAVSLVQAQISPIADLIVTLQPALPPVTASPEHLSDVWLNMLLNARDALSGREGAEIRVKSALIVDGNGIMITIQDNGQGIPQEHLDRIFDPFFTTKVRGHGLGLPLCYEVIRRHKGSITVDSREGVGTTMQITLPLERPPERPTQGKESDNGAYSHH
jgi:PAS domain S-box-containing protein